jgi:hypothetical protein
MEAENQITDVDGAIFNYLVSQNLVDAHGIPNSSGSEPGMLSSMGASISSSTSSARDMFAGDPELLILIPAVMASFYFIVQIFKKLKKHAESTEEDAKQDKELYEHL